MFEEELRRLQTDYIDYYLMHMLTDLPTWEKLKKLGMEDWIREKKASGEIRNIGFSYHGRSDMFMQLIDAYDWDFARSSIIIWTNIRRRAWRGCATRTRGGFR